jgi:hypothetical protein
VRTLGIALGLTAVLAAALVVMDLGVSWAAWVAAGSVVVLCVAGLAHQMSP